MFLDTSSKMLIGNLALVRQCSILIDSKKMGDFSGWENRMNREYKGEREEGE